MKIILSSQAKKFLDKIDHVVANRISKAIIGLASNPPKGDIKALKARYLSVTSRFVSGKIYERKECDSDY